MIAGPGGLTTIETNTPSTPPGDDASPHDIKAWVEEQLDLMREIPILGRFISLGPAERRRGGVLLYRITAWVIENGYVLYLACDTQQAEQNQQDRS
jgi:hypothetical protein